MFFSSRRWMYSLVVAYFNGKAYLAVSLMFRNSVRRSRQSVEAPSTIVGTLRFDSSPAKTKTKADGAAQDLKDHRKSSIIQVLEEILKHIGKSNHDKLFRLIERTKAILALRLIIKAKETYIMFLDMEKAFDCVKWNKLIKVMKIIGTEHKDRKIIHTLYTEQQAMIKCGEHREYRHIKTGARQACVLSSPFLNAYRHRTCT
ncbi:hypothetical protein ILUMI_18659 [Ignelater luminosus]|uniref:Reverse transcriptase domain-containing protein n=1 Tax=Ignelater luminosus TaxID=2038154 RepID=A0A8K0CHL1_IGNLU|nr:hypothetical protein ILUMI_18659 [Ignelater luminosus]